MILLQDQTESNIPTPGSKINLGYYKFNREITINEYGRKGHKPTNAYLVRKW